MAPSSRYYEDKRQREEERRQRELERRKEEAQERMRAEEKERLREEERREEARREALEFEAALERARLKREEMLTRLRSQKRIERKETDRQMKRREDLLSALREANRGKQREEGGKEQAENRKVQWKESAQTGRGKETAQERQKEETPKEPRKLEERRKTALEKAREAAAADRRKALEQLEKTEARRKQARDEMREQAIRARLEERKALDRASVEEERRRAELAQRRNEEETNVGRAEERRVAALAERNEKDREAEKEAERREEARREKLEEQRRQREKGEREAERREQLREQVREQRSLDKETRQKSGEREEQPKRAGQAASEEKETARSPLESRLPSGVLSGSLPWLLTYDNEIVTTEGEVVLLRGINLPDMEVLYAQADPAAGTGTARLHEAVAEVLSWGATIVRLGFKPGRLLPSGSAPASDYLERIDTVITRASAGNCYTALYPLAEPGEVAGAPYLSNLRHDDVVACLRALADRYASEPAVLLDLGCAPGDLLAGETPSRQAAWAAWIAVVPNLVADLRLRHPRAFCFVGGLDKGADVAGFPVTGQTGRPIPGLAYTASLCPAAQDALTRLKQLAAAHPVFVSEWGGSTIDMVWDAAWGERMAVLMDTVAIGWAASFGSGDAALLRPVQSGRFTLTPFGAVVKRALVRANARAETSTLARFSITM